MIANIVANYLVNKGKISAEQYTALFEELSKVRAKVGLIAVHEGFMTEYQADTVNFLQSKKDMRFGDLAVEKGFLTQNQVLELLKKQKDAYLSLAQALENMGIMTLPELDRLMKNYQVEHELSSSSVEALKSDNIDRIVPLFLPADADDYIEITTLAVKTIMRLVDVNILPMKAFYTEDFEVQNGALQFIDGDPCITTALAGNADSLLNIASTYGKEEFETVDMDALDAVAELINCINGMYASEQSLHRVRMELYPPSFDDSAEAIFGSRMLVLPLKVGESTVNLIICVGERLEFR